MCWNANRLSFLRLDLSYEFDIVQPVGMLSHDPITYEPLLRNHAPRPLTRHQDSFLSGIDELIRDTDELIADRAKETEEEAQMEENSLGVSRTSLIENVRFVGDNVTGRTPGESKDGRTTRANDRRNYAKHNLDVWNRVDGPSIITDYANHPISHPLEFCEGYVKCS